MNKDLEIEFELGSGTKGKMKIRKSEDWEDIESGTTALLVLVNGQQMIVEINEADECEGVSFKIGGSKINYYYDEDEVSAIFVEVR